MFYMVHMQVESKWFIIIRALYGTIEHDRYMPTNNDFVFHSMRSCWEIVVQSDINGHKIGIKQRSTERDMWRENCLFLVWCWWIVHIEHWNKIFIMKTVAGREMSVPPLFDTFHYSYISHYVDGCKFALGEKKTTTE